VQYGGKKYPFRPAAWVLALAAVVATFAVVPAGISATPRLKTIRVNATVLAHPVGVLSSEQSTLAGSVDDPRLGEGATVYKVKYPALTVTFVSFDTHGSFHGFGQLAASTTPNPDGSTGLSGRVHVTGGTGAYKGARGALDVSGTTTPAYYDDLRVTGSLKVPVTQPPRRTQR
jgi:hypothetical protein